MDGDDDIEIIETEAMEPGLCYRFRRFNQAHLVLFIDSSLGCTRGTFLSRKSQIVDFTSSHMIRGLRLGIEVVFVDS